MAEVQQGEYAIRFAENRENGSLLTLDEIEIGVGFRERRIGLQSAGVVKGCLTRLAQTVEAIANVVVDDVCVWRVKSGFGEERVDSVRSVFRVSKALEYCLLR